MTDAKFSCKTQACGGKQAWDYPSYDHIFIKGGAHADTFALLSYDCLAEMSDHYPILRCDNRYIFSRSLAVSGDFYFSRRLSSNIPPFLDKCPIGV